MSANSLQIRGAFRNKLVTHLREETLTRTLTESWGWLQEADPRSESQR